MLSKDLWLPAEGFLVALGGTSFSTGFFSGATVSSSLTVVFLTGADESFLIASLGLDSSSILILSVLLTCRDFSQTTPR